MEVVRPNREIKFKARECRECREWFIPTNYYSCRTCDPCYQKLNFLPKGVCVIKL